MTGVAKEAFQVLLRYNYVVKLFDADGMAIAEPEEARRMFASKPNLMVSLNDADDDSSIKLLFGKSTHANDIDGLMQALRTTATKYNLTFEPKQYGKEIDAKDYQNMMSVAESKKEIDMHLCEGMYGTSRSSYLQLDKAKVIVHHNERINTARPDARAHHINSIFIENAAGERIRFPSTELSAARKMAEHLNEGGRFNDATGVAIQQVRSLGSRPRPMTARTLAENNPVVRDFMIWTEQFSPDRALLEYNDPDDQTEDHHEDAASLAIDNFQPGEFLASHEWEDTLGGRSPNDGESELGKDEVMSALCNYMTHYIESYSDHFREHGFEGDVQSLAKQVYRQAAQAIQQTGYTISDGHHDAHMGEAGPHGEEFTREDILLPHKNQADGLSQDVAKATVHDDPADRDQAHAPNAAYLARMKTLAGMHSGRPV